MTYTETFVDALWEDPPEFGQWTCPYCNSNNWRTERDGPLHHIARCNECMRKFRIPPDDSLGFHTEDARTDPPRGAVMVHEPNGWVYLEDFAGSDLRVVNAAKVSFRKHAAEMGDSEEKILQYLMKNHHGTPFEHNYFQFVVRAPIFVFREWHRHRVGISINEQSARYTEMEPDFYVPDTDHVRSQVGKPGRYSFERLEDDRVRPLISAAYGATWNAYEALLATGLAKELARIVLPVGLYSQMYWTCNARSLMHFLSLRNAPDAMREIGDYAHVMENIFEQKMPLTAAAFQEYGRVAP